LGGTGRILREGKIRSGGTEGLPVESKMPGGPFEVHSGKIVR